MNFLKKQKKFTGLVIAMNSSKNETFSRNLRCLRLAFALTQCQLANEVNVSRSCLANYESGKRFPDEEILGILASFFGISTESLLSTDEIFLPFNININGVGLSFKGKTKNNVELDDVSTRSKIALSELCNFLECKQ